MLQFSGGLGGNNKGLRESLRFPVGVAIMELPVLATKTSIFAQPEWLQPNYYRFWMLDGNTTWPLKDNDKDTKQKKNKSSNKFTNNNISTLDAAKRSPPPPLCLKIVFWYCSNKEDAEEDDNDGYPNSLSVSLSDTSPYPETWPPDQKQPWLDWLQEQACTVLSEQCTSFSVCAFLERNALDFFQTIPLPSEDGEYFLVLFPLSSTCTHWQSNVDSLLFDPLGTTQGQFAMIHHDCIHGIKTPVTPAQLWPVIVQKQKQPPQKHARYDNKRSESKQRKETESENSWWLHPCILQHENWLPRTCPICLDDDFVSQDMVRLDCNHLVCRDCFSQYAAIQVQEISKYRLCDNPFKCPVSDCRQGIRIMRTVKAFLTPTDMARVRTWYRELKFPISKFLPQCLDCPDGRGVMRKTEIDGFCVVCETCGVQRCEYCIERISAGGGGGTKSGKTNNTDKKLIDHLSNKCKGAQTLKFARRYWRASQDVQVRCEAKYTWIKTYAEARVASAIVIRDWLDKKEGQVCPVCSHGVVRDEGCFHIQCNCGAHFCYECGEELFPPYYGTHHCWENR